MVKKVKGELIVAYRDGELKYFSKDFSKLKDYEKFGIKEEYEIYGIMSGEEFAQCVEHGGFVDYDGKLVDIFINDCKSNLGIFDYGISQGEFLIDLKTFKKICENFKVEVNWANN